MQRFLICLFTIVIIIMSMSACGPEPEKSTVTPSPTPSPTPAPTIELTPITTENQSTPTPVPEKLSYTTGLPFEGEYKPVMVVIENARAARPQTGLQTADVVYEVPVEGGITRLVCVFSDNVPDGVMPVRSCRVPFLYIQHEWDSVFMHYGGSGKNSSELKEPYSIYGNSLYKNMKFHIDGLSGKWSKYYYRVSGIGAPHNVMGKPALAQKLYDYSPEPLNWLFDSNAVYSGEDIAEINLKMCSNDKNYVSYKYDSEKDIYMRSMNGKAFKSKETGEQVSVKNLIVQYSTYKVSKSGIKLWKLVGEGKADFCIGGKLVHGRWERKTEDDDTVFYDDKDNQIALRPGNTWIHLSPEK